VYKAPWSNFREYIGIRREGVRKNTKIAVDVWAEICKKGFSVYKMFTNCSTVTLLGPDITPCQGNILRNMTFLGNGTLDNH
jgi:hypothetical protein